MDHQQTVPVALWLNIYAGWITLRSFNNLIYHLEPWKSEAQIIDLGGAVWGCIYCIVQGK